VKASRGQSGPGGGCSRGHVRSGMLFSESRRRRTRWIRTMSALVAMVLQLVLVAASVAEFQDAKAIAEAATDLRAPVGEHVVTPAHHGPLAHDETRCPACIARSLHAHLALLSPLALLQPEQRTAMELDRDRVAEVSRPSSHLSRAPPVAG
jgi:hypothetical protein